MSIVSTGVHTARRISAVDLRPDPPTRPMDPRYFSVRHPHFVYSLVAPKPFSTHMTSLVPGCLHNGTPKLAPRESRPFQLGKLGLDNAREAVSCVKSSRTLSALGFFKGSICCTEYDIVYRMLYPRYNRYSVYGYILLPQAFPETLGLFVQGPVPGLLT